MVRSEFKYRSLKEERGNPRVLYEFPLNNSIFYQNLLEEFFGEDPELFLLNNILISVQFFQNYERDIEKLRENWYKDIKYEDHEKRCFYADSLFRIIDTCVHFQPKHGPNKDKKYSLHPQRIYISSDNVEAAYDPSVLTNVKTSAKPYYQLTVKPCEDNIKEKFGYISLVEFKTLEERPPPLKQKPPPENYSNNRKSLTENEFAHRNSIFLKRPSLESKNSRRLTKTEKILIETNQTVFSKMRKTFNGSIDDEVLENGFYDYEPPEKRLNPKHIQDYRMNEISSSSDKIPRKCFQKVETKKPRRRQGEQKAFVSQNFLNSAAFKGYLCDLLLRQLGQAMDLDFDSVDNGVVHGEFILVNQEGVQKCITPAVNIKQWSKYVEIGKKLKARENRELEWPTHQMKKIIQILPCHAVPVGFLKETPKENLEYEREWKLDFPKAEEFLLLHMMHSHLKCYVHILLIYKSFYESEINIACFGPKHLLHLLFWLVHKNFVAWPEDKPGQNLIKFLETLYKKLRRKTLYDFFLSNRNLFSTSKPKDLHRAQTITKRILENPIPFILRAVRNLNFEGSFPELDTSKLYSNLKYVENSKKAKKSKKDKKNNDENEVVQKKEIPKTEGGKKTVRFDEDREWKKEVIKQISKEKKVEERLRTVSQETINIEEFLALKTLKLQKYVEIVESFILHFLEMGLKCVDFDNLEQALLYFHQVNKLTDLLPKQRTLAPEFGEFREKTNRLKVRCDKLKRQQSSLYVEEVELQKSESAPKKEVEKPKSLEIIKIVERKPSGSVSSQSDSDGEMETKL